VAVPSETKVESHSAASRQPANRLDQVVDDEREKNKLELIQASNPPGIFAIADTHWRDCHDGLSAVPDSGSVEEVEPIQTRPLFIL